jgi:hypothetical protein
MNYHWIGSWVTPRAGLDVLENSNICYPYKKLNPRLLQPSHYSNYAIPAPSYGIIIRWLLVLFPWQKKKPCTDLLQLFLCGYAACYSCDYVRYTCPITGKIKETYFSTSNATNLWRHNWQNMHEKLSKKSRNQTLLLQQWGLGKRQKNEEYMFYTYTSLLSVIHTIYSKMQTKIQGLHV